jgi:hypothetical protein
MENSLNTHSNWDRFVLVVVMTLIFIMAARTPIDSDMWWHLKSGEVMTETGRPLLIDLFSYTRYQSAWTNHSWLSEIALFQLYKWWNTWGLSIWVASLALLSLLFPVLQMDSPMILRGFLAVLGSMVSAVVWSPRPQMTSLVCLAGLNFLIQHARKGEIRYLWGIPCLFILWSNLHAGYSLGFILILFVFLGEGLNYLFGNHSEIGLKKKGISLLGWMTLLAVGCVAINPNGVRMWSIPFETVGMQSLQSMISEWASPDFHEMVQQPFLWMLCCMIILIGLSRCAPDGVELVCIAGFTGMSLIARRNFAPFALICLPIISRHIVSTWCIYSPRIYKFSIIQKISHLYIDQEAKTLPAWTQKVFHLMIAGFLMLAALLKLFWVAHPVMVSHYESQIFPTSAVKWIQSHPIQDQLFSEYDWGGYLVWHLVDYPVFVDGRTDLFGDSIISEWSTFINGKEGWEDILSNREINTVLVRVDRPIVTLLEREGWRQVWADERSVVMER